MVNNKKTKAKTKKNVVVNEIHKYKRKNFLRRRVIQKGINDLW